MIVTYIMYIKSVIRSSLPMPCSQQIIFEGKNKLNSIKFSIFYFNPKNTDSVAKIWLHSCYFVLYNLPVMDVVGHNVLAMTHGDFPLSFPRVVRLPDTLFVPPATAFVPRSVRLKIFHLDHQ